MSSEHTEPFGDADDVALFHRTLAELCRAEVPLPRAFSILEAEVQSKSLRDAAHRMAADVEAGRPLSEAYARREDTFPALYRTLVASGERAGDLPAALEQMAHHAAQRADVVVRMRRALAYPITAAVFVTVIGTAALVFAAPTVWGFTESVSGSSPLPIAAGALAGLALFVVGVTYFSFRKRKTGPQGGFRLPVIGPLRLCSVRASLASTLALLLRRKVPLHEALHLSAAATESAEVRKRVEAMASSADGGESLTASMRSGDFFEPSLLWLVETGEQSGEVADALDDIAAIYRRRLSRGLDRFSVLVRPAMELVVGVAVCLVAYSFMVPLMSWVSEMAGV